MTYILNSTYLLVVIEKSPNLCLSAACTSLRPHMDHFAISTSSVAACLYVHTICLDIGWSVRPNLFSANKCQHSKDQLAFPAFLCAGTLTDNKQLHHRGCSRPIHHGSNSVLPSFPSLYSPFICSSHIAIPSQMPFS